MMPAMPASRTRRIPSRSVDAAGDEERRRRPVARSAASAATSALTGRRGRGRSAARRGRRARRASARGSAAAGAMPRERGEPVGARRRARPRASRRRPRGSPRSAAGSSATRQRGHDPRRPGGEREPDRVRRCRRRRRAGAASRPAPRSRRPPRGSPGAPRRAPSKSTTWISGAPRPTKCSAIRSGRSVGAPMPVATPGQKTTRERPLSRSIAGMTCTGVRRPCAAPAAVGRALAGAGATLAEQRPAVEADRQRAARGAARRGSRAARTPPRAGACSSARSCEQQDLAQQVRQLVGRRVRVAARPRPARSARSKPVCSTRKSVASSIEISPRCIRTSRMIRQARQIASVCEREPELRRRRRSPARASSARCTCPSPRRTPGASTWARVSDGWRSPTASWRWWPGYASWMLVLLIEL